MRQQITRISSLTLFFLLSSLVILAQPGGVRVVVINEFLNIRVNPAIGAPVLTTVEAGTVLDAITARDGSGEWLRVEFECEQGWFNLTPVLQLDGDINALPVADPRSIPFGGFEAPRAGFSNATSTIIGRATDGLRVRSGPSTAYPTISNINFNQQFAIVGRTLCNNWLQVNFDGVIGWVSGTFVQQVTVGDLNTLPYNGVVAERFIRDEEAITEYIGILLLMLDRLDLAQPSLDRIRQSWSDAALAGRAVCQAYPPRPSNFPIEVPLLAANYIPLQSLLVDFNDAMANVRTAIDAFIEVCNQPGTANPVGQATAQAALEVINLADQQFGSLRLRLEELIPEDLGPGPNECLLAYNDEFEIIPLLRLGTVYRDEFTRRVSARGYCFNGIEDQVFNIQLLPIPPSQLQPIVAVSLLDRPDEFIVVQQAINSGLLNIGPIVLPETGRYVILTADLGGEGRLPVGEFVVRVSDITFAPVLLNLQYDPDTDSIELVTGADLNPDAPTSIGPEIESPQAICPSLGFSCNQLFTCEEAFACQTAGNFSLDANGDGVPCGISLCADQAPANATSE